MYGLLGELVRAVLPETEAHPAAIYADLLCSLGVSMGSGPFLGPRPRTPARLYTLILGPTGYGRKGTSRSVADVMMHLIDPGLTVVNGLSSGEGIVECIRDKNGTDDAGGTADKRAIFVEEEITKLIAVKGRAGATTGDVLKVMYDYREKYDNPRVTRAKVTKPHVGSIIHATPAGFARVPTDDIRTGFVNRYFPVWSEATKELPRGGEWENNDVKAICARIRRAVENVRALGANVCLDMDSEADIAWRERYHENRLMLQNRGDHDLNEMMARAPDHMQRIALISSLVNGERVLSGAAIEHAAMMWEYGHESMQYVWRNRVAPEIHQGVAWMAAKATADRAGEVMNHLMRAGFEGMNFRQLDNATGANMTASKLRTLVEALQTQGLVSVCAYKPPTGRPGQRVYAKGFEPNA